MRLWLSVAFVASVAACSSDDGSSGPPGSGGTAGDASAGGGAPSTGGTWSTGGGPAGSGGGGASDAGAEAGTSYDALCEAVYQHEISCGKDAAAANVEKYSCLGSVTCAEQLLAPGVVELVTTCVGTLACTSTYFDCLDNAELPATVEAKIAFQKAGEACKQKAAECQAQSYQFNLKVCTFGTFYKTSYYEALLACTIPCSPETKCAQDVMQANAPACSQNGWIWDQYLPYPL